MAKEKPLSSKESYLPDSKSVSLKNKFRNDGSFLEMFKKMQNASAQLYGIPNIDAADDKDNIVVETNAAVRTDFDQPSVSKPSITIGRRKGGRTLPVGRVKKLKTEEASSDTPPKSKDAWEKYLEEVKKYKETYCESDARNRSLVK